MSPARERGDAWRAVWAEEAAVPETVSEERLAAKLAKVIERLSSGTANMERPGRT